MPDLEEHRKQYLKEWAGRNHERIKANARAYYWRNVERYRKGGDLYEKYKGANRDLAKDRAYYRANKERIRTVGRVRERVAYLAKSPYLHMLKAALDRAHKKGLVFSLRVNDVVWHTHCPVFGMELVYGFGKRKAMGEAWPRPDSATLDRVDNSKGYVKGNVIVVSHKANSIKRNASTGELLAIANFYVALRKEKE